MAIGVHGELGAHTAQRVALEPVLEVGYATILPRQMAEDLAVLAQIPKLNRSKTHTNAVSR